MNNKGQPTDLDDLNSLRIMRSPSPTKPEAKITTMIAFPVIAVRQVSERVMTSEIAEVIALIFSSPFI